MGSDEHANFRDIVNVVSGLALNQQFAEISPEYPTFPVLVTESNRKQLVGNALKALAGGTRTKDANAVLDALEMLDGDRIEPGRSRYSQEPVIAVTNDRAVAWLIEAALRYTGKAMPVATLQSTAVIYPFLLDRPLGYVASNSPMLEVRSEGPSNQFVALRST